MKQGKLSIVTFAFGFLALALVFYTFFVVPNTGSINSQQGSGTFWGRYGYQPPLNNNLSMIGGNDKNSNVTSALESIQCSLTGIGGNSTNTNCPNPVSYDNIGNFIRFMVLGAYQALLALFSIFGGFKVVIMQLAAILGLPPDIVTVIIGGVVLAVFISWIIFIFNRSFEQ